VSAGAPAVGWREHAGHGVTVSAPPKSYAEKRARALLREAESGLAALLELLHPPAEKTATPVAIFITDALAEMKTGVFLVDQTSNRDVSSDLTGNEQIYIIVRAGDPGESVLRPLTRLLLTRWFGRGDRGGDLWVEGVAGYVAAGLKLGPPLVAADDSVRAEVAGKHSVSIFPLLKGEATGGVADAGLSKLIATSFVAFLIKTYGVKPFAAFLAGFDPQHRDQAVITAFRKPLGALEEAWLEGLRRGQVRKSPIRAFARQVLPLLRPFLVREAEVGIYMAWALAYGIFLPLSTRYLIDAVIPRRDPVFLGEFIGLLFTLYVASSLISLRRGYAAEWIAQNVLIGLQQKMFAHLQRLPHAFYARSKIGDIMARQLDDLVVVQGALMQVVNSGLFASLSALAAVVAVMALSPLLGGVVIIIVPLVAMIYVSLRKRLRAASMARQKLVGETATSIQESLSAYAVIRAFRMEGRMVNDYRDRLMALQKSSLRVAFIGGLFQTSITLAMTFAQLLVLGLGSYLVITGHLTIGTLLAFLGLLGSLFGPVGQLADLSRTIQTATGSMERIDDLLREPESISDKPDALRLRPLGSAITFENVSFGYDPSRMILDGLSLEIKSGEHVAIVGPSGSGKSTTINLILRFWDPDEGVIKFDGDALPDVTIDSLRGQIGLVFQDTFVFDNTIRQNIAIGKPGATDQEVVAAAQAAQLDTYIAQLPAGYETVLGERGVRMSGGQRQRLGIARALVRDPRVLIFDEATSALDAETERGILDTIAQLTSGRTTIAITHRLAMAAQSDRILTLDKGKLAETGPHAELVKAGGLYQRLWQEQMGGASGDFHKLGAEGMALDEIPLFQGFSPAALGELAAKMTPVQMEAGETVVESGAKVDRLYVVIHGEVEAVTTEAGHERRINSLHEGDYFGEMALLAEESFGATFRATVPTELRVLAKNDFTEILGREPAAREAMTKTLGARQDALHATTLASVSYCNRCGVASDSDATFCRMCGADVAPIPCPTCSTWNQRKAHFCRNCGGDLILRVATPAAVG